MQEEIDTHVDSTPAGLAADGRHASSAIAAGAGDIGLDDIGAPPAAQARRWRAGLSRLLYWLPVFVCMILFGQIAFLGLRPALCERRRLAAAEVAMNERLATDLVLRDTISANLRARRDPIFVERQRRLRQLPPDARGSANDGESPADARD
jgi:hypothetical protein